jgi:hypothetical protein
VDFLEMRCARLVEITFAIDEVSDDAIHARTERANQSR